MLKHYTEYMGSNQLCTIIIKIVKIKQLDILHYLTNISCDIFKTDEAGYLFSDVFVEMTRTAK